MKLVALLVAASLTAGAAPAKPKLRGTTDVAIARDGSLLIGDISNRVIISKQGGDIENIEAPPGFPQSGSFYWRELPQ